jgi:DNA repair protein RadD
MISQPQNALALESPSSKLRSVPTDWLDVLPSAADCLWDYQRQQIAEIAAQLHAGHRRILAQAPTGAGKTHIIATVAMAAAEAELRVLVLATRTRLVRQIHERLEAFDIRHGVIAAPLPHLRNNSARIQVASVDTLYRRAIVDQKIPLPNADVVCFDEAHLCTAETRLHLLESYPSALRLGLTATPARKSGLSLGAAFDCLILGPTIRALTAAGVLVPTRIFNTPLVSTKELRSIPKDTDSDFKSGPLGEMLSRPKLVGDVVTNWLRIASGKRTLCFAVNKSHGAALLESFRHQGIAAEMLTDADEEETREEIIGRLESGQTRVVINCFLLAYGVDVPTVECVILARPTRSLMMYLQMVGRGLRAAPGKTHCVLIDHGHVVENLGLPQSDYDWTLDDTRNVNAEALDAGSRRSTAEKTRTCGQCTALWLTTEHGNTCPECGWAAPQRSKAIVTEDADLEEMAEDEPEVTVMDSRVERFYRESLDWNQKHKPRKWLENSNKVRGACWYATKEKFKFADTVGIPYRFWRLDPLPCSADVAGWLKYRDIKWARGRGKARAA